MKPTASSDMSDQEVVAEAHLWVTKCGSVEGARRVLRIVAADKMAEAAKMRRKADRDFDGKLAAAALQLGLRTKDLESRMARELDRMATAPKVVN